MQHGDRKYLLGNEAIAYGLLESGVSIVSGHPGTPSSEIIPFIAQHIKRYEQPPHIKWSVNENVTRKVAAGAALCDVRVHQGEEWRWRPSHHRKAALHYQC
jgi:indolepyruvate ferredoxin oxidoreductase alpha subunit